MSGWQIAALTFGVLGWLSIGVVLLGIVKVAEVRVDLDSWQEDFDVEDDVPTSRPPLDKAPGGTID